MLPSVNKGNVSKGFWGNCVKAHKKAKYEIWKTQKKLIYYTWKHGIASN